MSISRLNTAQVPVVVRGRLPVHQWGAACLDASSPMSRAGSSSQDWIQNSKYLLLFKLKMKQECKGRR